MNGGNTTIGKNALIYNIKSYLERCYNNNLDSSFLYSHLLIVVFSVTWLNAFFPLTFLIRLSDACTIDWTVKAVYYSISKDIIEFQYKNKVMSNLKKSHIEHCYKMSYVTNLFGNQRTSLLNYLNI